MQYALRDMIVRRADVCDTGATLPQRALERDIEWGRLIGFENILHVLLNPNDNRRAANHQRRLRLV